MSSLVETGPFHVDERRTQARFPVDASLVIVAGRSRSGDIEVTRIDGRIVNVSVSAILVALEQPIEYDRIWVRVAQSGQSLCECVVVRHEAGTGQSHQYAVKFTCDWSAAVISKLLASLQ